MPRPGRSPPPVPAEAVATRRLPPLLRRAWYGLNQAFRRRIAHLGLTPDQYTVLRNLHEAGSRGMTQTALTQRMTSDPNTVASLVERMENARLLLRGPDPADRRARRLRLLPVGRRRFQAASSIARALQEEVLGALSEPEREGFLMVLEKLSDACRLAAEGRNEAGTRPGAESEPRRPAEPPSGQGRR